MTAATLHHSLISVVFVFFILDVNPKELRFLSLSSSILILNKLLLSGVLRYSNCRFLHISLNVLVLTRAIIEKVLYFIQILNITNMTPIEVEAIAEVLRSTPLDESLRIAADDVELKTPEQVIPPPVRRSNSRGLSSVRSPPELPGMYSSSCGYFASGNGTPSKSRQSGKHSSITPSKRLASPGRSTSATRKFDAPPVPTRLLSPCRQPTRTHSHSAATGSHASPAQKKRTSSQTFCNRQAVRTLSPRGMTRCDSAARKTFRSDSATRGKKIVRCSSKGTSERQTFHERSRKASVTRQGSLFSHDKPKISHLKKDLKLPQGEVMDSTRLLGRNISRCATDGKLTSPTFSRKLSSRRDFAVRQASHMEVCVVFLFLRWLDVFENILKKKKTDAGIDYPVYSLIDLRVPLQLQCNQQRVFILTMMYYKKYVRSF